MYNIEDKEKTKQCIWKTDGYQCQNEGHLSTGTLGEGPWYCRAHFARLMKWPAYSAPAEDLSQEAVDRRVGKIVPRLAGETEHEWSMRCRDYVMAYVRQQTQKIPSRDWAYRLLDSAERGEAVSPHALKSAQEVASPRQPGEDAQV